jgi:oligopeptidase B
LSYTSLTTPTSIYDYDLQERSFKLLKQQEVLGEFNKADYSSERLMVRARDGKKVPVSVVYAKSTSIDGSAPLLLYGYGSYGHNVDPYFSSVRLSLLNRDLCSPLRTFEDPKPWAGNGMMTEGC